MWKTGESPRGGAVFCPHPTVETFNSFHRACERNFCPDFFHRLSFHISQGLWRKFGVRMGGGFGVDFFEMKPCPHLGGVPPAAPFLSRQERGKECGLREALTGCFLSIFLQKQENRRRRHPAEIRTGLPHEMLLLPRGKLLSGSAQESVPPLISHGPLGRDCFLQRKPFYRQALILAVMV